MTARTTVDTKRACSANEVFHIARKACIGSGLTPDRAEDLAEATTLLQCSGHNGLAALHKLLVRQSREAPQPELGLVLSAAQMQADQLRPEAEGVAVIDWLVAAQGEAELHRVCDRLVMAGLLIAAAHSHGGRFYLRKAGMKVPSVLTSPQDFADLPEDEACHLSYQTAEHDRPAQPVLFHHTEVELSVWQALEQLAHLTYVPASEASRQSGAGAGLVDND